MKLLEWSRIAEEPLNPRIARRVIHAENMTLARISLRKDAVVPMHSHLHEQITMLESGRLRFLIGGEEQVLNAGQMLQIPPHAPHLVEALEDSVAVDLFAPVRDDWVRGDDAYLRK